MSIFSGEGMLKWAVNARTSSSKVARRRGALKSTRSMSGARAHSIGATHDRLPLGGVNDSEGCKIGVVASVAVLAVAVNIASSAPAIPVITTMDPKNTFTTFPTTSTSTWRRLGPARGLVVSPYGEPLGEWNACVAAPLDDEDHEVVLFTLNAVNAPRIRVPSSLMMSRRERPTTSSAPKSLKVSKICSSVRRQTSSSHVRQSNPNGPSVRKGGKHQHKVTEHTYRGLGCPHPGRSLRCCHFRRRPGSPSVS